MRDSRLLWMLVGALSLTVVSLLLGAIDISAPNYGRYHVSSWSTQVGNERAAVGAFIVDTATGETKTVYTRLVNNNGMGKVLKNELNKTFHAIQ